MNDFTLESQNCVMQFKLDTENNLLSLEVVNWTINEYGRRVDDFIIGYIDLSVYEVKFLRDSLTVFIRKIEGKK